MKNILKNLVFIYILLGIFSLFGNTALASSAPTIVSASAENITQTSADLTGVVNPGGDSTTAWFETPSGGPFQTQNLGNSTSDEQMLAYTLTGLTPNTSYTFRVIAGNGNGPTTGSWASFTTAAPTSSIPTIVSASASNITQTSAILDGVVNPNGDNTTAWFETLSSGPSQVQILGSGTTDIQMLSYTLTGLTPNTAYQFRIITGNINGPVIGPWNSFTTLNNSSSSSAPTIVSAAAANITQTSADLTGIVNPNGETTTAWFETPSGGPYQTQNLGNGTSNASMLTYTLTGLTANTTYTFRIIAGNIKGPVTGSWVSFTTSSTNNNNNNNHGGGGGSTVNSPSVVTQNATNIALNSATLNGTVNLNGYTIDVWFEYGTSSTLATFKETTHTTKGSGTSIVSFPQNITDLSVDTTYYFRIVANNSQGISKGNIFSFKTSKEEVKANGTITTVQATSKTENSAKLNGIFVNPDGFATQGYFEYGKNSSLGKLTLSKDLGKKNSISFSETIKNLTPDTIYYFRAVAVNNGFVYKGKILVFKTLKKQEEVKIETKKENSVPIEQKENPTVFAFQEPNLDITTDKKDVSVGDEVNYSVSFQNIDPKNLENVKISIQLPSEIDFQESNTGIIEEDNTLNYNFGILNPNQVESMAIKGKVNSDASSQNSIVTTVVMTYNLAGSTVSQDKITYVVNNILLEKNSKNSLEANPLFGSGPMSYVIGLLTLLLAILIVLIVREKFFKKEY